MSISFGERDLATRQKLVHYTGPDWLSYAGFCRPEQVLDWAKGETSGLGEAQIASLSTASEIALNSVLSPSSVRISHDDKRHARPFHPDISLAEIRLDLVSGARVDGETILNRLRIQAGGRPLREEVLKAREFRELPELEANLISMAMDGYPALLLPRRTQRSAFSKVTRFGSYFDAPLGRRTLELILADPDLARLFPGIDPGGLESEILEVFSSHLAFTGGEILSLQLAMLPGLIASRALVYCYTMGVKAAPASFARAILMTLDQQRRLACGEEVSVPLVFFLAGVGMGENLPGDGRGWPIGAGRMAPFSVEHEEVFDMAGQFSGNPDSVYDIQVPIRIIDTFPRGSELPAVAAEKAMKSSAEFYKVHARRLLELRLAFLLSCVDEEFVAPAMRGMMVWNPFGSPGYSFRMDRLPPNKIMVLDEDLYKKVEGWMKKMEGHQLEELSTSIGRLLVAAAERVDVDEAFLDGMIALEGLFSGRYDARFRVACSVARCAEPESFTARALIEKRVSRMYATRSAIVHGRRTEKGFSKRNPTQDRADVVRYATLCLRWLLAVRPDLIDVSSDERSTRILLA